MQHNNIKILPAEKVLSVLSYFTMGILGLILYITARFMNKKPRYFLMYNIKQSVIIGILLFLFGISMQIIFFLISQVKFLDFLAAILNLVLFLKIITIYPLKMSFSFFQLCVFVVLLYVSIGICFGKTFHLFFITKLTEKLMKDYN